MSVTFSTGSFHRLLLSVVPFLIFALHAHSQTAGSPVQDPEYAALLSRLKQGDTKIDLRAFRIASALKLSSPLSRQEFQEHALARKFLASGEYQAALDLANQMLDRNYASLYGHSDAMLACQKLGNAAEAALHENLVNALTDSIMKSGDGKSPETAWFVVDIPEEYFVLDSVLHFQSKSQSLVRKNGHAYDGVLATDPSSNLTSTFWFNTDVDMGLFKPPSQDSSTPHAGTQAVAPTAAHEEAVAAKKAREDESKSIILLNAPEVTISYRDLGTDVLISITTPDTVFPMIRVDVNQNGQIDDHVDTFYGLSPGGHGPCNGYLISERANTTCGALVSKSTLKINRTRVGSRSLIWVIPKVELSTGVGGANIIVNLYDAEHHTWQSVPSPSFSDSYLLTFAPAN